MGWSMRTDLTTPLVTADLDMAISQRKPNGVIHHSDRGSQYNSTAFGQRCQQAGIIPSMSRRGTAHDNAVAESFFATLETELLNRHIYHTRQEARTAIFDFIEGFYNPTRRHSTLGYQSPTDYEKDHTNHPLTLKPKTVHKAGQLHHCGAFGIDGRPPKPHTTSPQHPRNNP